MSFDEVARLVAKERMRVIERALESWSVPYGSVEKLLAEKAVVVTTRVVGTEYRISAEAIPLRGPLPRTGLTLDPDGGGSTNVELLCGAQQPIHIIETVSNLSGSVPFRFVLDDSEPPVV